MNLIYLGSISRTCALLHAFRVRHLTPTLHARLLSSARRIDVVLWRLNCAIKNGHGGAHS
jgi:hypothetical protein